jgi:hypothetical protein
VTNVYSRIGRVVTAAVIATTGASLALGWLLRRRPAPLPVVRCPIHGVAYDAELETCPECSKTAVGVEASNPATQPSETRGGVR